MDRCKRIYDRGSTPDTQCLYDQEFELCRGIGVVSLWRESGVSPNDLPRLREEYTYPHSEYLLSR